MQEDLLTCPICFEVYEEPVLLGQCGHTYCARCVRAIPRPLRCPTCRSPFSENTVLPNFALRALLRERGGAGASASPAGSGPPPSAGGAAAAAAGSWEGEQRTLCRTRSSAGSTMDSLRQQGVPAGLAKLLIDEDAEIALRIFLLDNSGSTAHPDGCIMEERPDGSVIKRHTTRWEEVKQLSLAQASWNVKMGTPCEFVLLNPAAKGDGLEAGIDFVRVDPEAREGHQAQLDALAKMLHGTSPRGTTPLTDRLKKIYNRISPEARDLARLGQKIVLVTVTDGLPTSGYHHLSGPEQQRDLANQLRRLSQDLPVHLVVRLCTDEDDVVNFYNSIDEEVELQLEVIDDLESEAKELYKCCNRWLVYSPLVHRIREGGTFMKLFDLLDERALTPMEICLFCNVLLRQNPDDPPLPTEPKEFVKAVAEKVHSLPKVYNPLRGCMSPPVLPDEVEYAVFPTKFRRMCGGSNLDIDCCLQ